MCSSHLIHSIAKRYSDFYPFGKNNDKTNKQQLNKDDNNAIKRDDCTSSDERPSNVTKNTQTNVNKVDDK